MDRRPVAVRRVLGGAIALVGAFALALQCLLLLEATRGEISAGMALLRFFSYFTILSNCLVVLATAAAAIEDGSGAGFFTRATVRAGIAIYIATTALVYAVVLHSLWQPTGAQWWADILLHYVVPVAYLAWWAGATPHGALRWGNLHGWLAFPLAFVAWIVFRQRAIEAWSPYPFLDLARNSTPSVLASVGMILVVILSIASVLLAMDRWLARGSGAG
ncbi:Pr6Pr family membrane protein [Luteimonas vadosa]|uniref:Pr6Pr family membrane protein n=1 Tax=Luteimonas vadosa TaxID=1165507 RepID=A0ABP9E4W9_9GAMM